MPNWIQDLYWFMLKRGHKISDLGIAPRGVVFLWKVYQSQGYCAEDGSLTIQEYIDGSLTIQEYIDGLQ